MEQVKPRVELFRRRAEWQCEVYGAGDEITLESVHVTVPVAQFYRRVGF